MRLFIAIEPAAEVKEKLNSLKRDIPGVRWLPPEQLHLTLLFLGDVAEEKVAALQGAMTGIHVAPFPLTIAHTGCFPNVREPKVIWAGIEHQPALYHLVEEIRSMAIYCGIPVEERSFSPHITLARIKYGTRCNLHSFIRQAENVLSLKMDVREFVVYQSTLTQQGAIHQPIHRTQLK